MSNYFSEEHQKLWEISQYPPSFYELLGFVYNEYAGTFNTNEARLQLFTYPASENDLEADKVHNFTKICSNFIKETNLDNDLEIKETTEADRKTIAFLSVNICTYLSSISFAEIGDLFIHLYKPPFGTYALALQQRMAFLTGTYLAHHKEERKFVFFNNYKKAVFTHRCMVELGDEEDEIIFTSKFSVPHCHKLQLNNGDIWQTMTEIINKKGFRI